MTVSQSLPRRQPGTTLPYSLHRLLQDPGASLGMVLVLLVVLTALFAEQVAPFGPTEGSLSNSKRPEAWQERGIPEHLLGTDQLGQDILSRIVHGSRVSLAVGFFGVVLASSIGVTLGMTAGYLGGRVDGIISAAVKPAAVLPLPGAGHCGRVDFWSQSSERHHHLWHHGRAHFRATRPWRSTAAEEHGIC